MPIETVAPVAGQRNERGPVFNEEAEMGVLGSILLDAASPALRSLFAG